MLLQGVLHFIRFCGTILLFVNLIVALPPLGPSTPFFWGGQLLLIVLIAPFVLSVFDASQGPLPLGTSYLLLLFGVLFSRFIFFMVLTCFHHECESYGDPFGPPTAAGRSSAAILLDRAATFTWLSLEKGLRPRPNAVPRIGPVLVDLHPLESLADRTGFQL